MCFESLAISNCGASGFCSEQDICICSPGWSQSLEMVYFPFTKEHETNETFVLETLPCSIHNNLLYSIFFLSLILNIFELIHIVNKLKSFKRFLRQIPLILALVFYMVCYGIRLVDPSQEYSISKSYTFTLGIAIVLQQFSTTMFLSKYIRYHLYKMKNGLGTDFKLLGRDASNTIGMIIPCLLFYDIFDFFLFVPPVYLNRKEGGIFFYIHYVGQSFRIFLFKKNSFGNNK
eukprot:snap_masked-scaffold_134-processed-gene-0.6-mRNA-1 protein AED:1.00 eAED:1.00 QI:0/0/0/0/1/1/2/0/231